MPGEREASLVPGVLSSGVVPGPAAEVTGRHPLDNGVVPVRTEGGDAQLSHGFALVGIEGVACVGPFVFELAFGL